MPIHILTLADNPSDLLTGYSEDLQPDPARRSAEQTRINDPLATVVCAPTMTIKVAERLESKGYKVDPLTLVFFRAKPIPFESKDEGMIIRLEFPPRPRDLWFLQDEQPAGHEHLTNLTKGRISMESILLHVKVIDGIPTILSFARSEDLAESMKLSFENNYWKHRFQDAEGRDILRRLPLPFFWYAVRRWDEVSEIVDTFIGSLETVFDTQTAQQLRALRTHLLYCEVLLKRFRDTLAIIRRTSQDKIVGNEFWKLLVEIERLEAERGMHEGRAKHVIDSIYSQSAVIAAGASIRDSRDMKQVSRLTMLFLPASVMAGIFGINSALFDAETSLLFYFILTIPLTVVIIWVFVAMQVEHYFLDFPTGAWYYRVLWPLYMFRRGVRIADSILV
ncbi:hypothetical protein EYR40_000404 [Pleurotus pulmonarius]|nr:hypothetical protein EYR36_001238 [Pleurotus pulmonarius]KAF4608061.1 hypothetical protein EYR40_000404 [Pleurotus pulmonarius]